MDETCQIDIPQSFTALYVRPGRNMPDRPWMEVHARYEQCEAIASMLQVTAAKMMHDLRITEQDVLERCYQGLRMQGQPFSKQEAIWIGRSLAEVLEQDDSAFMAFVDRQNAADCNA